MPSSTSFETFPVDIAYGAKVITEFKTHVFEAASGFEQRNIVWQEPRLQFDASTGIQDETDLRKLLAFFRKMKGRGYTFRFRDWSDYELTNQLIGTGDGTKQDFQIIKTYDYGIVRKITLPVPNTIKNLTVGGTPKTEGTDFTIDYDTGVIHFVSPPPSGADIIIGEGQFDVHCRFDTDTLELTLEAYKLGVAEVKIIEVRRP